MSARGAPALPVLSVAALDQALETILNNNFDADTKVCLVTLMKVLDATIQKPMDAKVRTIRLANPTFSKKVVACKGGVDFLLACGFQQDGLAPGIMATVGPESQERFLVLKDDDEDNDNMENSNDRKEAYKSHIIRARRLLMTRAIQDLHMKADQLPTYKSPPPPVATTTNFNSNNTNKRDAKASGTFDPYQTQRYDGMSAAAGTQLTPDGHYQSTTDQALKTLQQKQEKLEQKLQKELIDREWTAKPPPSASGGGGGVMAMQIDSTSSDNTKGSASLVAAQFQKQQAARKQREEGGFTTKSMREVERLKKHKVYTHTQLALRFADGTILQGKFLPKDTIQTVIAALVADCLLEPPSKSKPIQLYVAPPKKVLAPTATLQSEGLVPAAKVSVSFTLPTNKQQPFLKPELFAATSSAFPTSQPVVAKLSDNKNSCDSSSKPAAAAAKKAPMTAEQKEAAMMARMIGGGGRRLGSSGGAGSNSGAGGADAKKSKPGTKKPSWMK